MHLLLELTSDPVITNEQSAMSAGIALVVYVATSIGLWATLAKAGMPGWGALIPIYNIYLQLKLANYSGVLIFLYLIPVVNVVVAIFVAFGIARSFGRGPFFGFVLLFLLQPVGYFVTGFDGSKYIGARPWEAL
jgi:hypothetical protein